ncbi:hypothetical protein [Sphingomonas sp.]|uniref:hypothetical protein n=1 Tax=Sphingomonas sp. TaxID=28214 RepID=UPI0035C8413A
MLSLILLAQAVTAEQSADPWATFASVCMQGVSRLPSAMVRESSAGEIPAGAKHALGKNLIDTELLASVGAGALQVSASDDLPNRIFALKTGRGFLILPTGGDRKANPFAGFCAMVVEGDQYLAALTHISPRQAEKVGKKLAKVKGEARIGDFRTRSGRHEVSLTTADGWTSAAVNALN